MLKKFFTGLMAAALLFTTSCEHQDLTPTVGGEVTVSVNVSTPEIATRADAYDYSDGTHATELQYAVYHMKNGTEYGTMSHVTTDAEIHGSTTLSLQLTAGETYRIILWAAAERAPYTVDFETKTMIINYTGAVSNDETRDAFYAVKEFTVNGAQTVDVELKRPFAQLNIGTNDYAKAEAASGYVPTQSSVTVKGIYNTLNLADGTVSATADFTGDVTFGLADIDKTEAFPYDDTKYDYVAMNYVLVEGKCLVDVAFTLTDGTTSKPRTVGSVPVQRNYRTNIYGSILTSDVDVNVEITPDYDEPAHELDALHKAALDGGTVTLEEDVVLTSPLEVKSNLTLNLNGKTISGNCHKNDGPIIKNNGTMTIIGGIISSVGENGGSAVQNNGTMTINEVTLNGAPNANGSWPSYTVNNTGELTITDSKNTSYHGAVASYGDGALVTMNNTDIDMTGIPGFTSHGIYTYNNGKVIVNGGNIANKATDQGSTGASVINGAVEVNSGDFSGRIENYSGTPVLKGGSFSVKPNPNFIPARFKAVEIDRLYHVLPEVVADAADDANVTSITENTADVATALAANNGEATMFMWNDVAYIAKYQEVEIVSSADEATTVRGVVESANGLKKATVAEGIEVVGNRTFRKCANLETVVLPNTLTEIGPAVFQSCSKLANVTIPTSVTTIGEGAFAECTSLTSINIPEGITRLEKDVLRNTGLVSIEIPASVNYIGTYAFRDCESLTEVTILSPEFTIENNTFTNMAAPVPTMKIYVVNAEMKAYLDSVLTNYDKSYITVEVM